MSTTLSILGLCIGKIKYTMYDGIIVSIINQTLCFYV